MICEICANEYNETICPVCGWENELILDESFRDIYNQKKEKYSKIYEKSKKANDDFNIFINKIIPIYQNYFKKNPKLIDDILNVLETMESNNAKNSYASFLLPKAFNTKDTSFLQKSFKISKSIKEFIDKEEYIKRLETILKLSESLKDLKLAQEVNYELKAIK